MWKLLFVKAAVVILAALASAASARTQALPGGFVFLRDIDPTILQDIRYAGPSAIGRQGFVNYSKEWWHFSLPGAGGAAYDFPITARQR